MTLFLLLLAVGMAGSAIFMSHQARLMPLVALVPAVIAIASQCALDARPARSTDAQREPAGLAAGERQAFLALAGLASGALLIGVAGAVALFVTAWLRLVARLSWTNATGSGMFAFVAIEWGFADLGVRLPDGIVADYLQRLAFAR